MVCVNQPAATGVACAQCPCPDLGSEVVKESAQCPTAFCCPAVNCLRFVSSGPFVLGAIGRCRRVCVWSLRGLGPFVWEVIGRWCVR